jgi:hypothetical protein
MPLPGAENYILQETLAEMAAEATKDAKTVHTTAVVSTNNPTIDVKTETFTGRSRWQKPLRPVVNSVTLTDASRGATSTIGYAESTYVKIHRATGASGINPAKLVTQTDEMTNIANGFATAQATDHHDSFFNVLRGVAVSEALRGACNGSGVTGLGGQSFDNDPTDGRYGFYVDMGVNPLVGQASASSQGVSRASSFIDAIGKGFKDWEPDYLYLVTSPELLSLLRNANLVESTTVQDGNMELSTIFGGKIRILLTRQNTSLSTAELTKLNAGAGVHIGGSKMSFLIAPGAIDYKALAIDMPVEVERSAGSYQGGGSAEVWNRWGYVWSPAGYSWEGPADRFAENATLSGVHDDVTRAYTPLATSSAIATCRPNFTRKVTNALNLGILPLFHG